jgi:elongation factor P--beta-lysine ligase
MTQKWKYYGKRYLYKFLLEHGFQLPKPIEMEYYKSRGTELFETRNAVELPYSSLELIADPKVSRIAVYVYDYTEDDVRYTKTYKVYKNGMLHFSEERNENLDTTLKFIYDDYMTVKYISSGRPTIIKQYPITQENLAGIEDDDINSPMAFTEGENK